VKRSRGSPTAAPAEIAKIGKHCLVRRAGRNAVAWKKMTSSPGLNCHGAVGISKKPSLGISTGFHTESNWSIVE